MGESRDQTQYLLILSTFLLPPAFFGYEIGVQRFQNVPVVVRPLASADPWLYGLILGVTGGGLALSWGLRLRIVSVTGCLLLVCWPWVFVSTRVASPGTPAIPFVGLLMLGVVEAIGRFPRRTIAVLSRTDGQYAVAAGVGHLFVGYVLQSLSRQAGVVSAFSDGRVLFGVLVCLSMAGLVVAGAVPVYLWLSRRLIGPVTVLVGWFCFGVYETWRVSSVLPLSEFSQPNWVALAPGPDYALRWVTLTVLLAAVALGESALRSLLDEGRAD